MEKETTVSNGSGLDISSQELSRYVREICMENAKSEYDLIQTVTNSPPDPANPLYLEVIPRRKNKILDNILREKEKREQNKISELSSNKQMLKRSQDQLRIKYYEDIGKGLHAEYILGMMDDKAKEINTLQTELDQHQSELKNIRNQMERPFKIIIQGVDVALDSNDKNGLWGFLNCDKCELYSGNTWGSIYTEVTIECHKLIVRDALRISTQKLVVRAKHVQWEGNGCLDITPPDYSDRARDAEYTGDPDPSILGKLGTDGQNGKVGRKGGTILFFTEDWTEKGNAGISRLIANGGKGQEPGKGKDGVKRNFNGADGKDFRPIPFYLEKMDNANYRIPLEYPAIRCNVNKKVLLTAWYRDEAFGLDEQPPSGSDALQAGIPGSGGMNGVIITNHPRAAQAAVADVGQPGNPGAACTGGDIWTNIRGGEVNENGRIGYTFGVYNIYVYFRTNKKIVGEKTQKYLMKQYKVFKGKDTPATYAAPAKPSPHGGVILLKYTNRDDLWPESFRGDKKSEKDYELIEKNLIQSPPDLKRTPWFSPDVLEKVLDFARTCMLSGHYKQAEDLLLEYYQVFRKNGFHCVVQEKSLVMFERLETMLIKIKFGLDYYGNTAGYAPLLSLRGNLDRYRGEVERAMDTLIFTRSIFLEKEKSLEQVVTMNDMIGLLNTEISETKNRMAAAGRELDEYVGMWCDTSNNLKTIEHVRDGILEQARRQAEFNIHITGSVRALFHAAALACQFIPKGQPALGSASSGVASVFDVALNPANWSSGNYNKATEDVAKAVNEMAQNYFSSRASLTKREQEVQKLLKDKREELKLSSSDADSKTTDPNDVENQAAYETFAAKVYKENKLEKIPKAIQAASSEIIALVQALPISEDQIENEYHRLTDGNPQLQKYKLQLEVLKEYKRSLMQTIIQKKTAINYSYSKINEYQRAQTAFQSDIAFENIRVNPEFLSVAEDLERDALETLRWSQYLLVRAYEASTLQPLRIDLDWDLETLLKKLTDFMLKEENKGIKDILKEIYEENLNRIRAELTNKLASIIDNEMDWTFDLDRGHYPDLFAQLDKGSVTFDMLDITGMLFAGNTGNFVSEIKLKNIEFEENTGKKLNLWISLNVGREGVVQNDAGRYKIHGDEDSVWKWMISGTPSDPQIGNCEISGFSIDVLEYLLPKQKEKLRRFPLFSKYTVLASGKGYPRIQSLEFEMKISSARFTSVNSGKILLLKSRLTEEEGGAELKSILLDCTEDSRNRSYGFSGIVRYYHCTNQAVELNAALEPQEDFIFDHWQIIHVDLPEGEREEILTDIRVKVPWRGGQMEAVCRWRRGERDEQEAAALRMLEEALNL